MGYLGRRIGLSQDQGDSNPGAANGAVGGGILDLFAHGYFERQGDLYNAPGVTPPDTGLTASGGVVSDYTNGPAVYRAHIFTSSGTFNVTELGNIGSNVDYLVVAGGGSGSPQTSGSLYSASGGGGAGGLRTSLPGIMPATSSQVPVAVASYNIVIGAGGAYSLTAQGNPGTDTSLAYNGGTITSNAGGGGGETQQSGLTGGSGGGQGGNNHASSRTGGAANPNSDPTRQGYPGTNLATNDNDGSGGGGGGAGAAGQPYVSPTRSGLTGGAGVQVAIAGPTATTFTGVGAKNPANNQYQYFAGGGGGGGYDGAPTGVGGVGGGGRGETPPAPSPAERHGLQGTGGGGGGARGNGSSIGSGSGGSGIVIVRYQIGTVAATKATGGSVSFYETGGVTKTIHTFIHSGDFNVTNGPISIEYAMVGGGGSGGGIDNNSGAGGGGGAGGFLTGSSTLGNGPKAVVIGAGGGVTADGVDTTFNSLTAGKGGYGASRPGNGNPAPLGSGGGGAGTNGNSGGSSGPQGNPGGSSSTSGGYSSGGGGAGQAGGNGTSPSPLAAGYGGYGVQLPTTFRDPTSGVGQPNTSGHGVYPDGTRSGRTFPTPGGFWVAGGGGGAGDGDNTSGWGGAGGGGAGGAGHSPDTDGAMGQNAMANTGGGGGSQSNTPQPWPRGTPFTSGKGGSGIVLIAYPS